MAESSSYLDIVNDISDVAYRINRLVNELQPVSQKIVGAERYAALMEKNDQLQSEIARLDELRRQLFRALAE